MSPIRHVKFLVTAASDMKSSSPEVDWFALKSEAVKSFKSIDFRETISEVLVYSSLVTQISLMDAFCNIQSEILRFKILDSENGRLLKE